MIFSDDLPVTDEASIFGLSRPDARAWTAAKMRETEEYLQKLKTRHNSTAPVNCLPNELLVEIFCYDRDCAGSVRMDWLRLSRVCRYWRTVAFGSPTLWTIIHVGNSSSLFRDFLSYSGSAKVDISLSGAGVSSEEARAIAGILERDADRIVRLHCDHCATHGVVTDRRVSMPALKALSLQANRVYAGRDENEGDEGQAYHNHYFNPLPNQFPLLRSLSLDGVFVPWHSPVFNSLVHLEISNISDAPSLEVFLDVLQACPALEELVLMKSGPHLAWDEFVPSPVSDRKVSPSKLRRLFLTNLPSDIHYLLTHLVIPMRASVQIQFVFPRLFDNVYGAAFGAGLPEDPMDSLPVLYDIDTVSLDYFDDSFDIRASVADSPAQLRIASPKPSRRLSELSESLPSELGDLFADAPVATLAVRTDSECIPNAFQWNTLLSGFHDVEDLTVHTSDYIEAVFLVLGENPYGLRCEHLRRLVVTSASKQSNDEALPAIVECLRFRASCGLVLESFSVAPLSCGTRLRDGLLEIVAETNVGEGPGML